MRIIRPGSALLSAVLVLVSCSEPSAPRTPTSISVVAGTEQSAAVTTALAEPVVVEVRDNSDRPVSGVVVTWTVSEGGGTVTPSTTTTNGSGRAQVLWTLGTSAGVNRLSAGVEGVAPTNVTARAEAGAATSSRLVAGDGQIELEQRPLSDALVVEVVDQYGNGVPDVGVTFTPSAGVVTPQVVTTDGTGIAAAIWTLGSAGEHGVDMSVAGLTGEPIHATATALASGDILALENDSPVVGIEAVTGQSQYYRLTLPADVTYLTVSTIGGPGDADLFVRHDRLPTTAASDCQSTSPITTESCTVQVPAAGQWYVLIDAFRTYSHVTLSASYVVGGTMFVTVSGLPQGAGGSVVVRGPEHYEKLVTATTALKALRPGDYSVTAGFVRQDDIVYVSSPERQDVQIQVGVESDISVAYSETVGALNLDIVGAYITQSVQRADGSIPLIAGRDGLLRVFARGNAVSTEMPDVRARFYQGGAVVHTVNIPAPSATLPVSPDERSLISTWNVQVPGSLLQPGISVRVDVDPDNAVAEADETDNTFPSSGEALALDVRAAPVLQARLVPVVQANGEQGDVTMTNRGAFVTDAQALYPLPAIDVDVRAPYSFNATLSATYDTAWARLLEEINLLRVAESPERYYYGVIRRPFTSGGSGLGFIGQRAAIGVDWPDDDWRSETLAHEWGHNFGRAHVDCGGPSGPDPDYPYAGGRLGHHGYDIRTHTILQLDSHFDLLSYCRPTWASDYTYEAVMDFRAPQAGVAAGAAAGAEQKSLLVWGRITPEGAVLEPSFETVAAPSLPSGNGPYRLTAKNGAGATVLDISFDAYEIDHMPGVRLFAYAIPLSRMGGEVPAEIRLRGAGVDEMRRQSADGAGVVQVERAGAGRVRLQWDAARSPVLMVREGRTGEILSFARGGDALVTTSAPEVEIHMSNGVKSTMRRIVVPR